MAQTVGEYLVKRLQTWDVDRVFGYPGDGINGIMAGFEKIGKEGPRFVQVRHEEMAAFMACAHAKFTGDPGVCLATSGPGAIHLLNGLYDASMDHQPVVAIVGQAATTAIGGDYQQEVDLQTLFKDVARNYVTTVMDVTAIRHAIDRAFRIALSERCVTCVIVPKDLQEESVTPPMEAHNTIHSSAGWSSPRVVPYQPDLVAAAEADGPRGHQVRLRPPGQQVCRRARCYTVSTADCAHRCPRPDPPAIVSWHEAEEMSVPVSPESRLACGHEGTVGRLGDRRHRLVVAVRAHRIAPW